MLSRIKAVLSLVVGGALFAFALITCPAHAADLHLLYTNDPAWHSDLVGKATEAGTVLRTTNCNGLTPDVALPFNGSVLVENFSLNLCGALGHFGVVTLPVKSGGVRAWTEAAFSDGKSTNTVAIPALPDALPQGSPGNDQWYEVGGIENGTRGRATYIAFATAAGSARVEIAVFDDTNTKVGTEVVAFSGFVFYALQTPVKLGRAEVRNIGLSVGSPGGQEASVYAVAFVGRPEGGSPRVEIPARMASVSGP